MENKLHMNIRRVNLRNRKSFGVILTQNQKQTKILNQDFQIYIIIHYDNLLLFIPYLNFKLLSPSMNTPNKCSCLYIIQQILCISNDKLNEKQKNYRKK